ncbi:polysaccharide deacetylase family protein [Aquimarina muelleri]|uniref:polysaccharide deacetylase family protein n=1 Tax=Aquimarina muelleri TaxID=279356 RepID=UPI000409A72E|nr:polysaccharide deacetylase family protein [Aquimarina muelleri]MCX2762007.1 polysaccharide deacetylase family protein [Aquimarina muelleri]
MVLLLTNYGFHVSFWLYFLLAIIWLILTICGSGLIQWNYHVKSLNSSSGIKKNQVAITFDDGPNPEFTPLVLKLLKKYNAKATFFCVGKHIEAYPDLVKNCINEGHSIGNHTYSHPNSFGFLSTEKVISELQQTNAIAKSVVGVDLKLYRPAFGVTNPRIKRALKVTGLQSIGWSIRSLDTTSRSSDKVLKRITKKLYKGDIILLHDTSLKTIVVLEQLLLFLQQQNIESVTIDSLFKIKAYA